MAYFDNNGRLTINAIISNIAVLFLFSSLVETADARDCSKEYDYIIVGSGPGGGPLASNLAKANYSVLLLEAGDLSVASNGTQYPSSITWDFFVNHYSEDNEIHHRYSHFTWRTPEGSYWVGQKDPPPGSQPLGVYYPRGATLGGSSMINAMATWLPSDSDWNYVVELTGDETWSAANMRRIFEEIEHNNYVPEGTAGHGFDGWFQTKQVTRGNSSEQSHPMMIEMAKDLGLNRSIPELLNRDCNELDPNRDWTQSIYNFVAHQYSNGSRYSSRDLVLQTQLSGMYPLTVSLHSLATKILFDTTGTYGDKPRAIGVEYLQGESLYAADPRRGNFRRQGVKKTAIARKEVIVSGGAFNSPQILMLSGIGPAEHLREHNITVIVDSPGVGTNLMDNQELPIVAYGASRLSQGLTGLAMIKTNHSSDGERDLFLMQGAWVFRGFWPSNQTNANLPMPPPDVYSVSMVKNHPKNTKGTIRLRSADPQDVPDINFNFYAEGKEIDMGALKDGIAWVRRLYKRLGVTPTEPPCDNIAEDGTCEDGSDDGWIYKQTFGHHPTSTCRIGADNDEIAVLDSKFRVRGTSGLRVVDASAFARIPGIFPSVATFMISHKASDDILNELASEKTVGAHQV